MGSGLRSHNKIWIFRTNEVIIGSMVKDIIDIGPFYLVAGIG